MSFAATRDGLDPQSCRLAFSGSLDMTAAPRLRRLLFDLIDAGERALVLDLSNATNVDHTAVGVLVLAESSLIRTGGSLVVTCADPARVAGLHESGLTKLFDVEWGNGNGH